VVDEQRGEREADERTGGAQPLRQVQQEVVEQQLARDPLEERDAEPGDDAGDGGEDEYLLSPPRQRA
jgi:hypothetical protein